MEGKNFVLPGTDRVPSLFAASSLFFTACAGKPVISYMSQGLTKLLSYFVYNIDEQICSSLASILYYIIFILLPFSLYASVKPGIGEYVRIKPIKPISALLCALAAITGSFLASYINFYWYVLIEALGGVVPVPGAVKLDSAGRVLMSTVAMVVMPAVSEEILFRGALLSAWEEKGSKKALFITATLFMLIHSSIAGMPTYFICGLMLGYVVVTTDSLFAGMIFHFVYNGFSLFMNWLSTSDSTVRAGSFIDASGGIGGILGALLGLLIIVLIFAAGTMWLLWGIKKNNKVKSFGKQPMEAAPRGTYDYIVISCGIIVALALYASDIMTMLGVR